MQEDKDLKELLMKWSVQHPSADFTSSVMQRITAASNFNSAATVLLKQKLPRALCGAFVLVCIVLLALSFAVNANALLFQFTVKLPAKYLSQIFYFLTVFWIVMLFNTAIKKYSTKVS